MTTKDAIHVTSMASEKYSREEHEDIKIYGSDFRKGVKC